MLYKLPDETTLREIAGNVFSETGDTSRLLEYAALPIDRAALLARLRYSFPGKEEDLCRRIIESSEIIRS